MPSIKWRPSFEQSKAIMQGPSWSTTRGSPRIKGLRVSSQTRTRFHEVPDKLDYVPTPSSKLTVSPRRVKDPVAFGRWLRSRRGRRWR